MILIEKGDKTENPEVASSEDVPIHLKVNGYTFRGSNFFIFHFCLLSHQELPLKEKNLLP